MSRPVAQTTSSVQWYYAPAGNMYVATQVAFSLNLSNANVTRTLNFSNVQWNDNAANDTSRANQGSTAVSPPTATTSTPPDMTQYSDSGCPAYLTNQGGTQNVVFQHGLFANNCTWGRMVPWLSDYFQFGNVLSPNLNSLENLQSQGTDLYNDIMGAGGSNYILIGQSQGGLVSRSAAQQFQAANPNQFPPTVEGVLTLDTPNQGAPIAALGQGTINYILLGDQSQLWNSVGCNNPFDNILCYLIDLEYSGSNQLSGQLFNIGSITDLAPNSTFLNNLNSFPENFQKAAVVGHTHRRWVEARVIDSLVAPSLGIGNCYPEDACGERNVARFYGIIYDIVQISWDIAEFDCIWTGDPYACSISDYLFPIWVNMDIADLDFNLITAGGAEQDGIVPVSSQNYPSTGGPVPVQYAVNPSDSHTGDTKSDLTRNVLEVSLASPPFSVLPQSSCAFSGSPTISYVSGNGGSGTFSLSTGAGCHWDAVSQAPWISVTSGSSGTSSGSVGFTAAANPQTSTRTGNIQAGNGASSATVTVSQSGLCTYSLSPVGTLALQPSGGTYAVTVSTSAGCVWSVVSNASWITISAGASGTSSGSFSFTAAPNSGSSDLTGTITVMDQTLTVIIGSPVGTPGTGSVTISGSPQDQTFNMCPNSYPYNCWQTIPESGTVSITVNGVTSTVNYGGSMTAEQIASYLAGQISSSLVSATASGSTIYITSTLNGAATNYPLSTSYTFDSPYTSPAFSSYASGPSLTGGTD